MPRSINGCRKQALIDLEEVGTGCAEAVLENSGAQPVPRSINGCRKQALIDLEEAGTGCAKVVLK